MRRFTLFIAGLIMSQLLVISAFAQINTGGDPQMPFGGDQSNYKYGNLPGNLPSGGDYEGSQDAADAYENWKDTYVTSCSDGAYRVEFDDANYTVSEGIAYGMLLAVYAADKDLFDGLWQYYQNFENSNGVMDWKVYACSSVTQTGGATDAELDAAMALIIAAEQWFDEASTYKAYAKTLIQTIKNKEMTTAGQTLNGDAWGNTNTCRNPSYQAPAYYVEFAKIDTDNADFWSGTAVSAANSLLTANMSSTSGLVSNWCDNSGTENSCGNTGSGSYGYGADACRNPWRMAIDYLWHGDDACDIAKTINAKLIDFVDGYESYMKGPISDRDVSNPSSGSYVNGSYTTFALPTMTDDDAQNSLNKCYAAVSDLADIDAYFNSTIRCISLFVLTGNFWAPGTSDVVFDPEYSSAETNAEGTEIYVYTDKDLSTSSASGSNFTLYYNGTEQTDAISAVSVTDGYIVLTLSESPQVGQTILLSYDGSGSIACEDESVLGSFEQVDVLNLLEGNETILDDCDDGNEFNNVGGIWFTFNDESDQTSAASPGTVSSIDPLSSVAEPFAMTSPGYETDYAVHASFTLGTDYTPYSGSSAASWTNPAYVGIGTWVDDVETNSMDWTDGVGVSFMYKGPPCYFQVIIEEVTDYAYHRATIDSCGEWTEITVFWPDNATSGENYYTLTQPSWTTSSVDFSAEHVLKLQWQFETGVAAKADSSGEFWIDDVHILNMPPVDLDSMAIAVKEDSNLQDPDNLDIDEEDTLSLEIVPYPDDASYPVGLWSSSDEDIVTVDYQGRVFVTGNSYGTATITARAKMQQAITATFEVTVPAPTIVPETITFDSDTLEIEVDEDETLIPTFYSSEGSVTATDVSWTSTDNSIATVSSTGRVTGVALGTTIITCTSDDAENVSTTIIVKVIETDVTALELDVDSVTLTLGTSYTATATVSPDNASNKTVNWTSSETTVATVTSSGVISSAGVGTALIIATSDDNASICDTIVVTVEGVSIDSVTLDVDTLTLVLGEDYTFTKAVYPSSATQTVTWSVDYSDTVTVDGGYIEAIGIGTAVITATSTEDATKFATCTVTVIPVYITDIALNETEVDLFIDETLNLDETIEPADATYQTLEWTSSEEGYATVDDDGIVRAIAYGTTIITATATDGSGEYAVCTVNVVQNYVTSITLTPSADTVTIGSTTTLSASILPTDADDKTYTWSSEDDAVATVSTDGTVTGVSEGTVEIYATANDGSGIVGTATVVVEEVLPLSLSVTSELGFVYGEDDADTIDVTVLPDNTTNTAVTFKSSNTSVATVDENGVVTPEGVGECTITVTAEADNTVTATCAVTVSSASVSVTGVSLSSSILDLVIGEQASLTATVEPDGATNKAVTWTSSATGVATVSSTGLITAIDEGTTTITVTTEDGSYTATCTITVSNVLVETITLSEESLSLTTESENVTLTATITPDTATVQTLSWSSTNTDVVTVTGGIVTVQGLGTAYVIAAATDGSGVADSCAVTVSDVPVTGVSLSTVDTTVYTNSNGFTLTAAIEPTNAGNQNVSWTSTDEDVATVTQNGVVSIVGAGETTITVTTEDGPYTATCSVTVDSILVTGVTLDEPTLSLTVGGSSVKLTATVVPDTATNQTVTWTSSNTNVVTVTQSGLVTIVGAGDATITVTTEDGDYSATCEVSVSENTIDVTGVSITDPESTTIEKNETLDLEATIEPSTATDKSVTWTSLSTGVASVDEDGLVTPVSTGTVKIVVTTTDGGYTDTLEIEIIAVQTTSVALSSNSLDLYVGEDSTITATLYPVDEVSQEVTWSSDDETIATVDENGTVTAVAEGEAVITATAKDGTDKYAECDVTVSNVDVDSVTVSPESIIVDFGADPVTLEYAVYPSNATINTVTWSTSNSAVASVDAGVISFGEAGTATVTVKSDDNSMKALVSVEVVDKSVLDSLIDAATSLYTSAEEGTEVGDYEEGSKAELLSAISDASDVNDGTYSQDDVDAAIEDLEDAIKAFGKQKIIDETIIYDAELGNLTYLKTYVYTYQAGESTIDPLSTDDVAFTTTEGGANGTDSCAYVTGKLVNTGDPDYESAGLGFPFVDVDVVLDTLSNGDLEVANADEVDYDLSEATGISFWHKGDACVFGVMLSNVIQEGGYDHQISVSAHDDWTLVEVPFEDLSQASWVSSGYKVDFDPEHVIKLQWQVKDDPARSYEFGIDEVSVLGTVLDLPSLIEKDELGSLIAGAEELVSTAVEGDENGQYAEGSIATLQAVIDAASDVYDDEDATQEEVDEAYDLLEAAIAAFGEALNGEVDKTDLIELIETAQTLAQSADIGTDVGDYPQDAYTTFMEAIAEAIEVSENDTAKVLEVLNAETALEAAIEAFEASQLGAGVDRTDLETDIETASAYVNEAENGSLEGRYPDFAIEDLIEAISAANEVYNDGSASQSDIDQAEDALEEALSLFYSYLDYSTGFNEQSVDLSLFPNPFIGSVTLEAGVKISSATVYSLTGAEVAQYEIEAMKATIDLSELANGEYMIIFTTVNATTVERMIIKK